MSVTFTGDDPSHERAALVARAEHLGLEIGKSVTKRTDLLIAYEAESNSRKAAKARSYDVPIITTAAFSAAGPGVTFEAVGSSLEALKVVTCPDCFATWTVPAGSGKRLSQQCDDCAHGSKPKVWTFEPSEGEVSVDDFGVRIKQATKPEVARLHREDLISTEEYEPARKQALSLG